MRSRSNNDAQSKPKRSKLTNGKKNRRKKKKRLRRSLHGKKSRLE